MRLLLVEDYAPLRNSLAKGLREEGFAVDVAENGELGLWRARDAAYDVLILDLMLPKIDGLTLLTRLRAAGCRSAVLILTARDTVPDRVKGLNAGADDYLVKPFAFDELLARIRALIRRRYETTTAIITLGDVRIDTAARRVWRGEGEIDLSAREYALLEYLAVRAGQIVSRTDIWEHLYESDSSTQSNVVDVYVGYLRRKLDPPNEPSLIRTVRGSGYMMGGT